MNKIKEDLFKNWMGFTASNCKHISHTAGRSVNLLALCFDDSANNRDKPLETVLECNSTAKLPVHALAISSTSQVERLVILECSSDCASIQFFTSAGHKQSSDKECNIPPAVENTFMTGVLPIVLAKQGNTIPTEDVRIEGRIRLIWRKDASAKDVDKEYVIELKPS